MNNLTLTLPSTPSTPQALAAARAARQQLERQAQPYGFHGLFSQRDTLDKALEYAYRVIETSIPAECQLYAFTALHVALNTAALDRARAEQTAQEGTPCSTN